MPDAAATPTPPTLDDARAVLEARWGYPSFRPGQAEVIEALLEGRDALGVLPTGGGKSLLYQVPALLREGMVLVVSPLIALMQDQVAALRARRIPAAFINSTMSRRQVDQTWTDAEFGRYRLLYVAPERLDGDVFAQRAARLPVHLLAVDEAHCISEWGHHFRPAYLQIAQARTLLGDPPTLAVTATATPRVRRDVMQHLRLRDPAVVVQGFDRPNLVWSLFRGDDKRARLRSVVEGVPGSGVVYAATRRGTEEWAAWLKRQGHDAAPYHAGLGHDRRKAVQEAWLAGETRIVVATNAFGMGVDKSDVRFVVHVDLPATLEGYYQEAGRAGRDGERAYAVLLYQTADEKTQRALIDDSHPTSAEVRTVYRAVCDLARLALGSMPDGPVSIDFAAAARVAKVSPAKVRNAVELLVREGVWQAVPARRHHGLLHFKRPADVLRRFAGEQQNPALAGFVEDLLRTTYADAFRGWWELDLRLLERRTGLARARLLRGLDFLAERELLAWRAPGSGEQVVFTQPRTQSVPLDDVAVRRDRKRAHARLDDMLRYARSVTCRRQFLLHYFGEAAPARCGRCDVCLGRHEPVVVTPDDEPTLRALLDAVEAGTPRAEWDAPAGDRTDALLDWLVQEGYLDVPDPLDETYSLTDKARDYRAQWKPRG